jgi:uncharacterized delta-60 repeat protein
LGLAEAATGDWDRSYGAEGHLSLTDWFTEPGGFQPSTWQPQADGKLLLAGWGHTASSAQSYWVVRLNADGTRDTSFGGGDGIATLTFGNSGWIDLALQADGRILFVGGGTSSQEIRLVRLNTDGSRDTSFATGGELVIGDTRRIENPRLALAPDGSAIVLAKIGTSNQTMRMLVAKATSAGVLDASFGTGGLTEIVPPFTVVEAGALAVNGNGVIGIGGAYRQSIGRIPFVARVRSNGQPDSAFGTNDVVEVPFFNGDGTVGSVAVTSDGKVVAAGEGGDNNGWRQRFIARFNTNGALDPTFGSGGRIVASGTWIASMLLEPDGKLVVAGDVSEPVWNIGWLARYNVDGSPDVTFGLRGSSPVDFAVMAGTRLQRLDRLHRDADGSYRAIVMAWRYR